MEHMNMQLEEKRVRDKHGVGRFPVDLRWSLDRPQSTDKNAELYRARKVQDMAHIRRVMLSIINIPSFGETEVPVKYAVKWDGITAWSPQGFCMAADTFNVTGNHTIRALVMLREVHPTVYETLPERAFKREVCCLSRPPSCRLSAQRSCAETWQDFAAGGRFRGRAAAGGILAARHPRSTA
jgi:hypothetical protein